MSEREQIRRILKLVVMASGIASAGYLGLYLGQVWGWLLVAPGVGAMIWFAIMGMRILGRRQPIQPTAAEGGQG